MRHLYLIFTFVLCTQTAVAQLYSTAQQTVHSTSVSSMSAPASSGTARVGSYSTLGSYPSTSINSLPAVSSAYTTKAWKCTISEVGATLGESSNAPTIRRAWGGFPDNPAEPNPDPPVPLGDIPWGVLALLAIGYIAFCKRKRKESI